MNARFNLKPMEHIGESESKQLFTRNLFAEVAPKYDFITKAMSFGHDAAWKRHLLARLPASGSPVCVDIACGTGDMSRMLAQRYEDGQITGLDLTPEMLKIADKRTEAFNVSFVEGSMHHLPFDTDSTDIITGGYALRNAPDLNRALDEIQRILRPGGIAAFLDFSKPRNGMGQWLSCFVLKVWGGFWGLLMHGNPDVYGYIADSLKLYPDRIALRERFFERSFILLHHRCFFGGLLEITVFQKEDPHAA